MSTSVHVRVSIGREDYALPVEQVLEVAELQRLAAVPGAPRAVLGVCNLRGDVLPVVDLASLLRIESAGEPARVVVAQNGSGLVGLAVDSVHGVGPLPEEIEEVDSSLLSGAVLTEGSLVGLLDLDRVVTALGGDR